MTTPTKPSVVEDAYTLTPLQRGLLALSVSESDEPLYISRMSVEINGALDLPRWQAAWQSVMQRHGVLRSFFRWHDRDQPVQIVHRNPPLDWSVTPDASIDWRFDCERPPLHRHVIQQHAPRRYTHHFLFHHALLDGWSVSLLLEEVYALYQDSDHGRVAQDTTPFKHYVAWQAQAELDVEWWREYLRYCPVPCLTRSSTQMPKQSECLSTDMDASVLSALRSTASSQSITLNTQVMAAWLRAVSLFTGESSVQMGFVDSGRHVPIAGIDTLVGLTLVTLPIRAEIDGSQSVQEFLRLLFAHQRQVVGKSALPLHQIAQAAGVSTPDALFDTVLVFQSQSIQRREIQGVRFERPEFEDHAHFPISLIVTPSDTLRLALHFDAARVSEEDAQRLFRLWKTCLMALADSLPRSMSDWPGLSLDPPTQDAIPTTILNDGIEDLIWRTAAALPDHPALVSGELQMTYAELTERVDSMAMALINHGVAPTQFVVIALSERINTLLMMLAVMRAAGVFCVVDASTPLSRLENQLSVLQQYAGEENVYYVHDAVQVPNIFEANQCIAERDLLLSNDGLDRGVLESRTTTIDALAYVLFTSGSTGEPKAVQITRANLSYSTQVRGDVYDFVPQRFLLLSALFFDSSLVGVFWTLSRGGTLVLPGLSLSDALPQLASIMRERAITATLCLPSVHQLLLESLDGADLKPTQLRHVLVAGEACPMQLIERHRSVLPDTELYNEYGPTEATVWCTSHRLDTDIDRVSIGTPIPGTSISIVDGNDVPVVAGAAGQLVIHGSGVAKGYISRDATANDAFAPLPVDSHPAYRSGDLVRLFADDSIEWLGRIDLQLKINGQRVEPGDIESVLLGCDNVQAAVVVGPPLVAHIQATVLAGESDDRGTGLEKLTEQLRYRTQQALPAHMRVSTVNVWRALPLLPNGKVDRQRLDATDDDLIECLDLSIANAGREQDNGTTPSQSGLAGPEGEQGDIETMIAHHWQLINHGDVPTADRNFFDDGGDSLRAVSLLIAINRQLGSTLSLADLYAAPTVAGLASHLRQQRAHGDWVSCIAFGATSPQHRMFFAYGNGRLLADALPDDFQLNWIVHGRAETVVPISSWLELAQQHLVQIKSQQLNGPYHLAGFSLGAVLMIEVARLLVERGDAIGSLILIDPTSPVHYQPRGRLAQLRAVSASKDEEVNRVDYVKELAIRAPQILSRKARVRLHSLAGPNQQDEPPGQARSTLLDAPVNPDRRAVVLELVDKAMSGYRFTPLPCEVQLVLIDRGRNTVERTDDYMVWRTLAPHGLKLHTVRGQGSHTALFREPDTMAALARIIEQTVTTKMVGETS